VRPRNYIDPSLGEGTDKDEVVGASGYSREQWGSSLEAKEIISSACSAASQGHHDN